MVTTAITGWTDTPSIIRFSFQARIGTQIWRSELIAPASVMYAKPIAASA